MTTNEVLGKYQHLANLSMQYARDAFRQQSDGQYMYDYEQRNFIVNAAFLKFFFSWESYLEDIFKCILTGKPSIEGNIIPSLLQAQDEAHAGKIIIGVHKYFDWANHEYVIQISNILIGTPNPIHSAINSIRSDLQDMRTIRNASAHLTSTVQTPLNSLYQRLTGILKTDTIPSDILFKNEPSTRKTYWNYYKDLLDIAAENIAKGLVI